MSDFDRLRQRLQEFMSASDNRLEAIAEGAWPEQREKVRRMREAFLEGQQEMQRSIAELEMESQKSEAATAAARARITARRAEQQEFERSVEGLWDEQRELLKRIVG